MAIVVPIASKWDPSGVDRATRSLKSFGDDATTRFGRLDDAIGKTIRNFGLIGIAAAGAATVGLVRFGFSAIEAAEQAEVADNRLKAIAQSMGLFGDSTDATVDRIGNYADQLERTTAVDGDLIKSMQAQLLTFESVGRTADKTGSIFDRATAAALDLQAANLGGGEAAVALGKALEDPIRGITALRKSGVTFTDDQQELIRTLVESGRTLEAQDLILKSVERQVGGTAEATATASAKMRVAFEQVKERVGKALLPTFERLTDFLVTDLIPRFDAWWQVHGPEVERVMGRIGEVVIQVATEWGPKLVTFVSEIVTGLKDWWQEGGFVQTFLSNLATWLLDNPDKLDDLAITFLAVAGGLKAISIYTGIATMISGIGTASGTAAPLLTAFGAAGTTASVGLYALAGGLAAAAAGYAAYKYLEKPEVQDMMESDLQRQKNGKWWDDFGSGISSVPFPMTAGATGGIVRQPTFAMIGEAGPEAVIPLNRMPGASPLPGDLGGGVNITVTGAIDPVGVADQIAKILNQRGYRNGAGAVR